jgi:hypothetical protein
MTFSAPGPAPATSSVPRRRFVTPLVIALAVGGLLAGLFFAGDRFVVGRAEERVSARLQEALNTSGAPEVDIGGFPFLTQLLTRRFRDVRVVAEDVLPPGEPSLPARRVDLTASEVTRNGRDQTLTAKRVDGTATLELSALPRFQDQALTYAGEGRVAVPVSSDKLGLPVAAEVTGLPKLDVERQTVTLVEPKITVSGIELPVAVAQGLLANQLEPVPITGLPLGLGLTSLTVDEEGAQVGVVGDNVVIPN